MVAGLLDGAPPGTLGMCSESGWINSELFLQWLQFFVVQTRPTQLRPQLLIVDNHKSHRAYDVLEYASQNHVIMLSVPPHTTHRLQPLDRTVYGPMSTFFEQATDAFQKKNPGRRVVTGDKAKLFGNAYLRACTMNNAISGFAACGIHTYDDTLFQ